MSCFIWSLNTGLTVSLLKWNKFTWLFEDGFKKMELCCHLVLKNSRVPYKKTGMRGFSEPSVVSLCAHLNCIVFTSIDNMLMTNLILYSLKD